MQNAPKQPTPGAFIVASLGVLNHGEIFAVQNAVHTGVRDEAKSAVRALALAVTIQVSRCR